MFYFKSSFYYHLDILTIDMSITDSNMSPCKRFATKTPKMEASTRRSQQEKEPDTPRHVYNDTMGFIEKGISLKMGVNSSKFLRDILCP
jgi:hypothetical protein